MSDGEFSVASYIKKNVKKRSRNDLETILSHKHVTEYLRLNGNSYLSVFILFNHAMSDTFSIIHVSLLFMILDNENIHVNIKTALVYRSVHGLIPEHLF